MEYMYHESRIQGTIWGADKGHYVRERRGQEKTGKQIGTKCNDAHV